MTLPCLSAGTVSVPEELKFPHACCVGIASQTYLSVLNPTDRWLQVSVGVLSVSVNGEKVSSRVLPLELIVALPPCWVSLPSP